MMHNHNVVVALTDTKNKPYREYRYEKLHENCKKSDVILPYDQSYKILIKNQNSCRLKMEVDIDGSIITGAGGLVLNSHCQEYIERFIDSDRKFLFVRKTDEKVSDPSNKENGLLTIKIEKEKTVFHIVNTSYEHFLIPKWVPLYRENRPYWMDTPTCGGWGGVSGSVSDMSQSQNMNYSSENSHLCASNGIGHSLNQCFFSSKNLEVGATVEGEKSNQTFSSTYWAGSEGDAVIFQFKMLGKDPKLSDKDEKDRMEYERLKAKFD